MIISRINSFFYKYKRKLFVPTKKDGREQKAFFTNGGLFDCNRRDLKILFFGTDSFSLPSLMALHKHKYNKKLILGVVTSFKNPPNCVRLYAEQRELPLIRWPIIVKDVCSSYDLGVVVSFGHLIPEQIIRAFPLGIINVHASLLPRWRGAAPIIHAIMNGDTVTGVSIMKVEPKHFDIGDILVQSEVPIESNIFMPELHERLANIGARLLIQILEDFPNSFKSVRKQNNKLATYAPKITSIQTEVIWAELNSKQLYDRYRALFGYKWLGTKFQGKNIHLIDIKLAGEINDITVLYNTKPGSFVFQRVKKCLLVRCAENTFIEVYRLRVEGKKVMSAVDFNNGFIKDSNKINSAKFE